MDKVELLQRIGNEVCEDCGISDCGLTPIDCCRITNAIAYLDEFIQEKTKEPN